MKTFSQLTRLAMLALACVLVLAGCGGGRSAAPTPETTNAVTGAKTTRVPGKFEPNTTMANIQKRGYLLVGLVDGEEPFSNLDASTGSWVGFDVEVAKIMAIAIFGSQIEGKIRWIPLDERGRELALDQGRVDIALGRYIITQPRKRFIDFAGPYYVSFQEAVVSDRSARGVSGLPDLNGRKICTVQGSTFVEPLQEAVPGADISMVRNSVQQCAAEVIGGQAEAVVADHIDLLPITQSGTRQLSPLRTVFGQAPYGIGVKRGDVDFRKFLNDTLEKDVAPAYAAAFERTVGDQPGPMPPVDRY